MLNEQIKGELSKEELIAIAALARSVPPGGVVVEVGSYMGLSSWHWAKNVDASVTVYCVDPWDGYRGSSLQIFLDNTADCPNIVPVRGRSPVDLGDWDRAIDVYFDDAVHTDPILSQNIEFWTRFLKPDGLVCGHDYAPKFPDVMAAAHRLAGRSTSSELHVIGSLWAVLGPVSDDVTRGRLAEFVTTASELSGYRREPTGSTSPEASAKRRVEAFRGLSYAITDLSVARGDRFTMGSEVRCRGSLRNDSGVDLPVSLDDEVRLKVGAELWTSPNDEKIISARGELDVEVLLSGAEVEFELELRLGPRCLPGEYELRIDLVYEHLYWFRSRGAAELLIPITIEADRVIEAVDPELPIEDVWSWKQFVPSINPESPIGLRSPRYQEYVVSNPSGEQTVRSMLSVFELSLLYGLARRYTGEGEILDLGPLMGLTTNVLARGLLHNPRSISKRGRIWSYDLFLRHRNEHFCTPEDGSHVGSLFPRYLRLNRDYLDELVIIPGDFSQVSWSGAPIEIMFVDLSKSFALNQHLMREFFPHMIPGKTVLIQQDYAHSGEPWVSMTMEHLSPYFEMLYPVYGATGVFRLKQTIPREVLDVDLASLPLSVTDELFERAIARNRPTVAEILKSCRAADLLRHGELDRAEEVLRSVDPTVREPSGDVTSDFGLLIEPNARLIRRRLEAMRRRLEES